MYLDFKLDESYTPNKISIRAGSGVHDLKAGGGGGGCDDVECFCRHPGTWEH